MTRASLLIALLALTTACEEQIACTEEARSSICLLYTSDAADE